MDLDWLLPVEAERGDRWRWGTVTQASPLRVRLDGDTDQLDLTPDTLTTGLAVDERVYCHLAGRSVVVIGKRP